MKIVNSKIIFGVLFTFLILIFSVIYISYAKKSQKIYQPPETIIKPTLTSTRPTSIQGMPASSSQGGPTDTSPTLIQPTFTGGNLELPKDEVDLSKQKQALRGKLPLIQPLFTITYDYDNDKFIVQGNKTAFEKWLKENYPIIPVDRFTFK